MTQSQKIVPCLWFDSNAEEAANFYTSLFANAKLGRIMRYGNEGQEITGKPPGSVLTVEFQLAGFPFVALNGGPLFTLNPAISFWVTCESAAELDALWAGLAQDGMVLMPLDTYPWSEKYGWVQDKFGVTWQIALGKVADTGQTIIPFLMYGGNLHGRAEEAIRLYTETFRNSAIDHLDRYAAGEGDMEGAVKHAEFELNGEKLMAIDGGPGHAFTFNEAISLQIMCETQAEIDHFWAKLTANGGEEGPCGWLKDPFGVSWQVAPTVLHEMLNDPDPARTDRVTKAYMQMKKFDIEALKRAYTGDTD